MAEDYENSQVAVLPGLVAVPISWTPATAGQITVLAERATDHMVVHPVFDRIHDDEFGYLNEYSFSGSWTVTHRLSGLGACPLESLPTVESARDWALIFQEFPGLDLTATDKETVMAGVDVSALQEAWLTFRNRVWSK